MANIMDMLPGADGPTAFTTFAVGDMTIPMAVGAVIAVVMCLFGLKLIRVWNALWGLILGAAVGAAIGAGVGLDSMGILIAAGVGAVVLAALAAVFKKFGAFLVCLFGMTGALAGILIYILGEGNLIFILVSVGAALVVAILAMIWFEPLIIIVTSFYGGTVLANAVSILAGIDNIYITWAIGAVTVILGIAVQFMMKSREIVKKQVKHAETVKGEISKESEVEMARTMLDDEEDDED